MIYLVHGIRSRNAQWTMGGLQAYLTQIGLSAKIVDYGYILVPLGNTKAKRAIKNAVRSDAILVGYSNGCAAIHSVAEEVDARHIVLISPALPRDAVWPPCVESVTVFYSPGDRIVGLGGLWAWIANRAPWRWGSARNHPWGRMGLHGPHTDDPRVTGIEMGRDIMHSWYKYPEKVNAIAHKIADIAVSAT